MIRMLGVPRPWATEDHSAEPVPNLTVADIAPALLFAFGKRMTVARIQHTVADFYGVSQTYMNMPDGKTGARERKVARPRQMAMYLSRELTDHSLPSIGKFFGRRDHTTVMHALKAVERRVADDPYAEIELEVLREKLSA